MVGAQVGVPNEQGWFQPKFLADRKTASSKQPKKSDKAARPTACREGEHCVHRARKADALREEAKEGEASAVGLAEPPGKGGGSWWFRSLAYFCCVKCRLASANTAMPKTAAWLGKGEAQENKAPDGVPFEISSWPGQSARSSVQRGVGLKSGTEDRPVRM